MKKASHIWLQSYSVAGFQCIPANAGLSVVTSVAFQAEASFFPDDSTLTVTANINETVTLIMRKNQNEIDKDAKTLWKKNGVALEEIDGIEKKKLALTLTNIQEGSAGMYSLEYEDQINSSAPGYVRLIVRMCPEGLFGDNCNHTCPLCMHGGICHDITGECICAPGFSGELCEKACKPGYFGKQCSMSCSEANDMSACSGVLICLPDPYGCSCAAGFTGIFCNLICLSGTYGAGCHEIYAYSHNIQNCSRFSGSCDCIQGWHDADCTESYPILTEKPHLVNIAKDRIKFSFRAWSPERDLGSGTPQYYQIVYKESESNAWFDGGNVTSSDANATYESEISRLTPGTEYLIGIIVVDESGNSQEQNITSVNVRTLCDIPSFPPFNITLSVDKQNIFVSWQIPSKIYWNCKEVESIVKYKQGEKVEVLENKTKDFSFKFDAEPFTHWWIQVCLAPVGTNAHGMNCSKWENVNVHKDVSGKVKNHSSVWKIVLGLLLPFALILAVAIVILYIKNLKMSDSSLKVKFFPSKDIAHIEFEACNETLDEMFISETDSLNEEPSNCIPISDLLDYVNHNSWKAIKTEFMSVPNGQVYPCTVAKMPENKLKNRYGNILPYDHNRVNLNTEDNGASSDYIHASYINGYKKLNKYIATQGPLAATIFDFWTMIWQEKSCKILMITNIMENGRVKCEKYWTEDTDMYGNLKLTFQDSESYADFVIRTFTISKDHDSREIKQFHFNTWPDHGVPINVTPFVNFLKKYRNYQPNSEAPIVVHCSAGIGRTGTTILLDSMMDMGMDEGCVDVLCHFWNMRKQRMNIVENLDQYLFVHYALVEALYLGNACIKCFDFISEYTDLQKGDEADRKSYLQKQLEVLNKLSSKLLYRSQCVPAVVERQGKTRSMLLSSNDQALFANDLNYIKNGNAAFFDSYSQRNAFIVAKYPALELLSDFWNMIYEMQSRTVVLLQDIDLSDGAFSQFWPAESTQKFGALEIECLSTKTDDNKITGDFCITFNDPVETRLPLLIKVICIKGWQAIGTTCYISSALWAVSAIKQWQWESSKHVITVICSDGRTSSGIFCAFLRLCDRIELEHEVDVFQAVKGIKVCMPQFSINMAQYTFLYDLAAEYLKSS